MTLKVKETLAAQLVCSLSTLVKKIIQLNSTNSTTKSEIFYECFCHLEVISGSLFDSSALCILSLAEQAGTVQSSSERVLS